MDEEMLLAGIGILVSILLLSFSYKKYFSKRNNTKENLTFPKIKTKNTFLHTTDNFGKMEKGVVSKDRQG